MSVTPVQARAELARRELTRRRESARAQSPEAQTAEAVSQPPDHQQVIRDAIREKLMGPVANLPVNIAGQAVLDPKRTFDKYGAAIPIAAGMAGGPAAPATAAGGELLRQFIGTAMGSKEVPESAMGRAGSVLLNAAGTDRIANPLMAMAGKTLAPAGRVAGKFAARAGETISGVPARQYERLWKDPAALFIPKTLKKAGDDFGAALKKEGIDVTPTPDEVNDPQLSVARRTAKGFFEKMQKGVPMKVTETVQVKEPLGIVDSKGAPLLKTVEKKIDKVVNRIFEPDASDILKAKRATDRQIGSMSWKDKTGLRNLFKQKSDLNELFEKASGKGAQASKDYARSALAASFRKIVPETQTGKISLVKSVLIPLLARSALTPALSAPMVHGLTTAAASGGAKAAGKISQSQSARLAIIQALMGDGE